MRRTWANVSIIVSLVGFATCHWWGFGHGRRNALWSCFVFLGSLFGGSPLCCVSRLGMGRIRRKLNG